MNEIVRDGGVKSLKLWFSVFAVAMICLCGLASAWWSGIVPIYPALVGGVVTIAGLYLTGHVAQMWVGSKAPATPAAGAKADLPAPRFTE